MFPSEGSEILQPDTAPVNFPIPTSFNLSSETMKFWKTPNNLPILSDTLQDPPISPTWHAASRLSRISARPVGKLEKDGTGNLKSALLQSPSSSEIGSDVILT